MGGRDVAGKSAKNCLNGEGFVQENMKRRNSHPIITPHFPTPIVTGPSIIYETISKKIDWRISPSFVCVLGRLLSRTHIHEARSSVGERGGRGSNETCLLLLPLFPTHSHTGGGWVGIGERGLPSPSPSLLTTRRLSCSERGWM